MTKRERAQVVELLRCAADYAARGRRSWLDVVAADIGIDYAIADKARVVGIIVQSEEPFRSQHLGHRGDIMPPDWCLRVALEAAQRVEEGTWP